MARPTEHKVEIGSTFGNLQVLFVEKYRDKSNRVREKYLVRCRCGTEEYRTKYNLVVAARNCFKCAKQSRRRSLSYRGTARVWDTYKDSAAQRGLEFSLDKETLGGLIIMTCFYCGDAPNNKRLVQTVDGPEYFEYNGIDRVDNSIGYVLDNVVPCCGGCNYAKRKMTAAEFIAKCKAVTERHESLDLLAPL